MSRLFTCALLAGIAVAVGAPTLAQDTQDTPKTSPPHTSKPAPEIDPDAAKYADRGTYIPPGPRKSVEIGNYYLRRKKYYGALSRFQEAVEEDPNYAPAYLGLGKVYDHIGLKQKALDAYRKYLDALPSEKDAQEAKNVQRAVARLEKEVSSESSKSRGRPAPPLDPPQVH